MQTKTLRQPQTDMIKLAEGISKGSILAMQAPTGVGKNISIQESARARINKGESVLIVSDRDVVVKQLIKQAKDSFGYIEYSSLIHAKKLHVCGSVKAVKRELYNKFDTLIVDEAHTKRDIIKRFKDKEGTIIGFSATMLTLDIHNYWGGIDNIKVITTPYECVESGYILPLDFSKIVVTPHDFDRKNLEKSIGMNYTVESIEAEARRTIYDKVAEEYILHGEGKQGIVLCSSEKSCIAVAEKLNEAGIATQAVTSKTGEFNESCFNNGTIRLLTTCYKITRGWDNKNVDVILDLRPTLSLAEYVQTLNRGCRLREGKVNYKLIDFVGNWAELHGDYLQWYMTRSLEYRKNIKKCQHDKCKQPLVGNEPVCKHEHEGLKHLTYKHSHCRMPGCKNEVLSHKDLICKICEQDISRECQHCKGMIHNAHRACPLCFGLVTPVKMESREKYNKNTGEKIDEALVEKDFTKAFNKLDDMDSTEILEAFMSTVKAKNSGKPLDTQCWHAFFSWRDYTGNKCAYRSLEDLEWIYNSVPAITSIECASFIRERAVNNEKCIRY